MPRNSESASSTTGELSVDNETKNAAEVPPGTPPQPADTGVVGEDRPTMPISEVPVPGANAQRQADAFAKEPSHAPEHTHRFEITTRCKACGREVTSTYASRSDSPGACEFCGGPTVVEKDVDKHA